MSLRIRDFDALTAPESVIRGAYEVRASVEQENFPDDRPAPYEYRLARWRHPYPEHEIVEHFYAEEDGLVVGFLTTFRLPFDDPANLFADIAVHTGHRQKGVGRALLRHALEHAGEAEKLILDSVADRPWEPALERLGMRKVFTGRRSRLTLAEVDWALMGDWIARASDRASQYEIIHFESRIPDEYLEGWARIKNVMNTAPDEDLELADFDMTPEKWRGEEEAIETRGDEYLAVGAFHRPSGQFAGLSDVFLPKLFPEQAWQEDTGVDPEHRNKGLGRWLKAEMIKRIARDHPEVERIDTSNAGSNEPMLAINVEMGFRPVLVETAWQGAISDVRRNL